MKHIIQKYSNDCGIASLAMLHETSYRCMHRFVKAYFARKGQKFDGVHWWHVRDISRLIGSPVKLVIVKDQNKLIHRLEGKKAILRVPARDGSGDAHAVFWDRDTLYDPSPARRYGKPGKTAILSAEEAYILIEDD